MLSSIPDQIAAVLLAEARDPQEQQALQQAREIFDGLLAGRIDRSLLTPNADAYFTPQVLEDASVSLKALGTLESLAQSSVEQLGGMTYRHFEMKFKQVSLRLDTLTVPSGKLEQYLIREVIHP